MYHLDCHDGGIGDEDYAVHVSAVDVLEEDVEFGYVEAFQLIQSCTKNKLVHSGTQEMENSPFNETVLS